MTQSISYGWCSLYYMALQAAHTADLPPYRGGALRGYPGKQKGGDDMKQCWVCGQLVKTNTRKMHCSQCQGSVVTPDEPPKRKQEKLSFKELERMMQSANTYERRGRRVRQKRWARD